MSVPENKFKSWPRGLSIIFWLAVLGLIVGLGQTLYWILITNEFIPHVSVQGAYAASALVLATTCVILGVLRCRRAFAIMAVLTCGLHIVITAYFNLEIVRMRWPDIFAGWNIVQSWNVNSWIYIWNCFEIMVNAFVCFYLLRYEFGIFAKHQLNAYSAAAGTKVMIKPGVFQREPAPSGFWRRISAVLLSLLGLYFLVSAAGAHVDGLRTRHIEYVNNLLIFVLVSLVLLAVGAALLFAAWRLWRVPRPSNRIGSDHRT